ncbi:MAG: carbohydrate-binding domain-containing protein [Dysgonamonadaceae bacterium]|jgi:hypothetical protein|nr:carbohydrate-binding domain-containing protein [Dysgonamonadaceae bacterium]
MKTKKLYAAKTIFLVMLLSSFFSIAVSAQEELSKHDISVSNLSIYDRLEAKSLRSEVIRKYEVFGSTAQNKIVDVLEGTHEIILDNVTIDLADGCPLTIGKFDNGRTVEYMAGSGYVDHLNVKGSAVVTLILKGDNVLRTKGEKDPGIRVSPGATLIIEGDGTLTVESASKNNGSAGILLDYAGELLCRRVDSKVDYPLMSAPFEGKKTIPMNYHEYCGSLVVNSGTITATGGGIFAGIGDGSGMNQVEIVNGKVRIQGNQGGSNDEYPMLATDVPFTTKGGSIIINGGRVTAIKGKNCEQGDIVTTGLTGTVKITGGTIKRSSNSDIRPYPVNEAGVRLYPIVVWFTDLERSMSFPFTSARFKRLNYGVASLETGDGFWMPGGTYLPEEINIAVRGIPYVNKDTVRISTDGQTILLSDGYPEDYVSLEFKLAEEVAEEFKINATYGNDPVVSGYKVPLDKMLRLEVVKNTDDEQRDRQYIWEGTGLSGMERIVRESNTLILPVAEPVDITCSIFFGYRLTFWIDDLTQEIHDMQATHDRYTWKEGERAFVFPESEIGYNKNDLVLIVNGKQGYQYAWTVTGVPYNGYSSELNKLTIFNSYINGPIEVKCTIRSYPTGIAATAAQDVRVSLDGSDLSIDSPVAERVTVYSVAGTLLHRLEKSAGKASFAVASTSSTQVLIVRGSSGWARKIIVND